MKSEKVKIKAIVLVICAVFLAAMSGVSLASTGTNTQDMQSTIFEKKELNHAPSAVEYIPDEILVKFKTDVREDTINTMNSEYGASVKSTLLSGTKILNVPSGKTVDEMVKIYESLPEVEYAEPNYIDHAFMVPNDPFYSYQWHLENDEYGGINMESAWDISTGTGVVVAVLDSGVAYEDYGIYCQAPDLAGTTFVAGYDFVNNDAHPNDDEGHGTHVAGTIAQTTNNNYGVAGVAFDCSIMPIKTLNATGSGTLADFSDGVHYAVNHGADIISYSGGGSHSNTKEEAVEYAYTNGVTFVAAAGNEYEEGNTPQYPAAYDDYVIAVGATRYDKTRSYYSNTGSYLDLTAPGGDTTVDQNGDGYDDGVLQETFSGGDPCDFGFWFFQGTSMATPHVSGVAALLIANGVTDPDNIRNRLQSTAEDKGAPGWDEEYGWGIVDAEAAIGGGAVSLEDAVDNLGLSFTTGGDADWFGQTDTYYYDGDAAESGDIFDYQNTWIETTVTGPEDFSFYWKGDSETNYDYLRFYIDGVEQDAISGSTSWAQMTYSIDLGSHTLKWEYTKDGSASVGEDCGWVDKVEYGIPGIPDICVAPTEISVDLPSGTLYDTTLTIGNDGDGTLYYDIIDVGPGAGEIFFDDMESGENGWTHGGNNDEWEFGTPIIGPSDAYSGSNCWGTDLDGNYNNYADQWLMSPSIDLSGVTEASLSFYRWYNIEYSCDNAYVEISTDGGATWDTFVSYTGSDETWEQEVIDISPHTGSSDVRIRFRLSSDHSITYAGLYIDDVSITTPGEVVDWLSETPESGSVDPGENAEITITFDTWGLELGEYYASKIISSNDPDEPEIVVPINLIISTAPDIWVAPTSFDMPLPTNTPQDYILTIGNDGNAMMTYDITDTGAGGIYAGGMNPGVVYKYLGEEDWEVISPELGYSVLSLVEYEGNLYAGSKSTSEDSSVGQVYRYDGENWVLVGDNLDSQVCTVVVYEDNLYAGTVWNGMRLYRYNDLGDWTMVVDYNPWSGTRAAYEWNGYLYLGDISYDRIGRYDGVTFEAIDDLEGSCIWDFQEYNDYLYAGAWKGRLLESADGMNWEVTFSYQDERDRWALEEFQGYLYSGLDSGDSSPYEAQLRKWDGISSTEEMVWATPVSYSHEGIISMETTNDYLYIGMGGEATYREAVSVKETVSAEKNMRRSSQGTGKVYRYDGSSIELIGDNMGQGIQTLYVSGVGAVDWLSEYPLDGSVPPESRDEITVTINTTSLDPGDYSANIIIANNDPDENPTIVPVNLTVLPPAFIRISTDATTYSPGDTLTTTVNISNPIEDGVRFQWYWIVPQFSVCVPVMSLPIPAGYNDTFDFRFPIPNWGPLPFGNVFYVQLLNASSEVLDADCCCWAYSPSGEAMPAAEVDIAEEIKKTIGRVE